MTCNVMQRVCASPALKASPAKKGRVALNVPKFSGPGSAWSASQFPSERDQNIYDLRGARSFPVLENDGTFHAVVLSLFMCFWSHFSLFVYGNVI